MVQRSLSGILRGNFIQNERCRMVTVAVIGVITMTAVSVGLCFEYGETEGRRKAACKNAPP